MRTLVISDLHLGNGGPYDAFAGPDALPAFLDHQARQPAHVFVNGDGVDFLMNEDPLEMSRARAAQQAQAIAACPATAGVLRAFGRVLARGGAVTIRLGNHDLELSLPEVQQVLRAALDQPAEVAARLEFQLGVAPKILDVGGARVLVTHGEHGDKWNKVEYATLQQPETYKYTAGSTLVKEIMNPLTRQHGLRFMNFLKPDFSGGALAAFAVNPGIVKAVFTSSTIDILGQLLRRVGMTPAFAEEEDDVGIGARLDAANLDDEEKRALEAMLGDGGIESYADESPGKLHVKLARAGLELYAGAQRRAAGSEGADTFFDLEPDKDEWGDARRLASKEHVGAVIYGHSHAARWKEADGLVFANTGTWIWLMQLPPTGADVDAWADFLAELKDNPRLDPARQKNARPMSRFTAVILDPHAGGGAAMSLAEWKNEKVEILGRAHVPPTRA
jgi:UDP-2,3-diacylglucosamine pyrophosphatase LpxH